MVLSLWFFLEFLIDFTHFIFSFYQLHIELFLWHVFFLHSLYFLFQILFLLKNLITFSLILPDFLIHVVYNSLDMIKVLFSFINLIKHCFLFIFVLFDIKLNIITLPLKFLLCICDSACLYRDLFWRDLDNALDEKFSITHLANGASLRPFTSLRIRLRVWKDSCFLCAIFAVAETAESAINHFLLILKLIATRLAFLNTFLVRVDPWFEKYWIVNVKNYLSFSNLKLARLFKKLFYLTLMLDWLHGLSVYAQSVTFLKGQNVLIEHIWHFLFK